LGGRLVGETPTLLEGEKEGQGSGKRMRFPDFGFLIGRGRRRRRGMIILTLLTP
jgi:hypothetical protein